ncbi:MAG: glycosyltransferase family 4 protein [Bacteroidia bacterium]
MKENHPPKVVFLGKLPPPYIGPSVACQLILKSKLKDNFQLLHLDTSDHRDINTLAKMDFTNFYLAFKQYYMLFKMLVKDKPDMVYIPAGQTTISYFRDAGFILLAKLFGKKVICHLRGGNFVNWYNSTSALTKMGVRSIQKNVDGQIVLGDNLRPLFNWMMPENRIHVVPNGSNYPTIPKNGKVSDKVRILFLGNFIGTKGVLMLLKSSPAVFAKHKNVEFLFAGNWRDEPTKIEFEKFLNENPGLPVTIIGPVQGQEKFDLLSSADIFVFPTFYPNEGHPWVIVEAMSAGLPVISTDHAAISESVLDGKNGFLVEKRNPQQIADKINYLIEHPEERKRMGEESRKHYLANFTEEKMVERMTKAFNATLHIN